MTIVSDFTFDDSSKDGRASNTARGAPDAMYRGDAFAAGGEAHFDGRGDYLEVPPDKTFALSRGTITMSFEQSVPSPGDDPGQFPGAHTLISIDSTGNGRGGHLTVYITSTGRLQVRHQTATESHFYGGGRITPGDSFTFSYSWGPDGSRLFLNGRKIATGEVPLTVAGGIEPIVIGASQVRSDEGVANKLTGFFEGSISRVQITDEPVPAGGFVPCLAGGTRVLTDRGARPVETLRPGDLVRTMDNGLQPVRWIGSRDVDAMALVLFRTLRPVVVAPHALGNAAPLVLSRQHCVLLPDGAAGTLVRAAHLARFAPGACAVREEPVPLSYWHLLFDRHEVILAENVPVESLLPGPAAQIGMPALAAHVARLAPACRARLARSVRPVADGRAARACIARFGLGLEAARV